MNGVSVSIIIPANDEQAGISELIRRTRLVMDRQQLSYEILVIDDGSVDNTARIAAAAGATVLRHPYNIGNGAAVKSGIRAARGEIIVTLDGDGQHPPEYIPDLIAKLGDFHMAVGARSARSHASLGRKLANHIYNLLASYVSGRRIEDLTSGFRAVRTPIAREFLPLLPNTFSYPTTITLCVVRSGYTLVYLPFEGPPRPRDSKSKIRAVKDGSRFFMIIFRIATLYSPLKIFLPVSAFMFSLGLGYGLFKVFFQGGAYGPTAAMLMTVSSVVFLLGLVSEQIAQQRFEAASFARLQTADRTPTPANPTEP